MNTILKIPIFSILLIFSLWQASFAYELNLDLQYEQTTVQSPLTDNEIRFYIDTVPKLQSGDLIVDYAADYLKNIGLSWIDFSQISLKIYIGFTMATEQKTEQDFINIDDYKNIIPSDDELKLIKKYIPDLKKLFE